MGYPVSLPSSICWDCQSTIGTMNEPSSSSVLEYCHSGIDYCLRPECHPNQVWTKCKIGYLWCCFEIGFRIYHAKLREHYNRLSVFLTSNISSM